jgi:hypothetical protein
MGRPPTTVAVCQEVHALLLESGVEPGAKIPRPLWNELVGKCQGPERQVSWAQAENITRTGAMLGLWERVPHSGRVPGSIMLRDAVEA